MSPDVSIHDIQPDDLRRIARNRRSFWAALALTAVIILGAGMVAGGGWWGWSQALSETLVWALHVGAAVAPGLVWLGFFALLEREDEGGRRVAFLLWIITAALYLVTVQPLLARVFQLDAWLFMGWWADILADFLIVAPLEMLLVYLILRYGVYPGETMRRLVDGPLFGVASALGAAAIVSLIAVWPNALFTPDDVLVAGERALGYAALGGWLGYALARNRFSRTPGYYLPGVFLLVVSLHALFYALVRGAHALAFAAPLYSGLVTAAILALLSFALLAWRVRKRNRAFLNMAARVEIAQERERPPSLLGDVLQMADARAFEGARTPPPPPPTSPTPPREEDELASLKRSWEALIAEQEEKP